MVLNPIAGYVSPQYHVVFDDDFTTFPFMHSPDIPPHLEALVKSSTKLVTDEDYSLMYSWYKSSIAGNDVKEDLTAPIQEN